METRDLGPSGEHKPGFRSSGVEDPLAGKILDGRYQILGALGAGGVGVVYRAEDRRLGRLVAVKVLHKDYVARKPLRLRFEREARALAALSHPNIVAVSDYGVAEDIPFLVMELLTGETLKQRLAAGPATEEELILTGRQILMALSFAHDQGLIHRDLKPGNIFLRSLEDGGLHASILDFGMAKFVTADEARNGPQLTMTGMVFGTPAYMSPEQAAGVKATAQADLYSMGVVLFEMIAGRLPFLGDTSEILRQHMLAPPPTLAELCQGRRVAPALEALIARALAKSTRERFQSAREMLQALDALPTPLLSDPDDVATQPEGTDETLLAPEEGGRPSREATRASLRPPSAIAQAPAPPSAAAAEPTELVHRPSATAPRRSRSIAPVIAVVLVVGLLLVSGLVGLGALLFCRGSDRPVPPGPSQLGPVGPSGPVFPAAPVNPALAPQQPQPPPLTDQSGTPPRPTPTLLPTGSPLDRPGLPQFMAEARRQLTSGQALSPAAEQQLRSYAWTNPRDSRPYLLWARHKVLRGALTDAIERYERAYDADPTSRSDPWMLEDLVKLSGSRSVGWRAARALGRIYGASAIPAVDRALADPELDPQQAARLRQVRQELASGG